MAANEEKRMIVGLDIGTSKVVAVVGVAAMVLWSLWLLWLLLLLFCLLYTSPSPRDVEACRLPSWA